MTSTVGFAHPKTNAQALGIEHGMKVADFGAGSGAYTFELAHLVGSNGTVYAVDIQQDLLKRIANEARHRALAHVEILCGDLEQVHGSKIPDGIIDLVLISNILFQVPDKIALLEEARRVLKRSGRLAIIDWQDSFKGLGPHPDHVVTKDSALEFAARAGFVPLREFAAGAHHYGILLRQASHTD